jgi:hypothetical protein
MIPNELAALLREHRNCHALTYPPHGNADHGPMAYLALHALGGDADAVRKFARSYRQKLAPLRAANTRLTADNWQREVGHIGSYPELLNYFDAEVSARGWRDAVALYLPRLISGAVRGAFHPLIRLAYAIEAQFEPEVAAGLAFLACTGPDTRLEQASAEGRSTLNGAAYLRSWQEFRLEASTGRFDERYDRVLAAVPLRPAATSTCSDFSELSRACLEIFDASHDFFALHLVTGSAAFRVCAAWLKPDSERLLSVALAATYITLGAPDFWPVRGGTAALPLAALASATDEHDIKLAHACRAQADAFSDTTYVSVAARYLAPRLAASARLPRPS